jgi:Flp pilus assembly pilin Flp
VDWFNAMYLRVSTAFRSFRDREEGQGLVEYAVLLGLITAGVIGVIQTLGIDVLDVFTEVEGLL